MDLQAFFDDFLHTDNLDRLTQDAAEMLNCPLMIVDDSFHAVSWHMPDGFRDVPFQGSVDRGELTYEASSLISNATLDQTGEVYMTLADSPWQRRFSALIASGIRVGYLVLVDVHGTLRSTDHRLLRAVEAVLAKQLFFQTNRSGLMFNTAEEVLLHLLEGRFETEALFRLQASSTWLASFHPQRFALINLGLYHNLHLSHDTLKGELTYAFYASHPFVYNNEVVLFLSGDHDLSAFQRLSEQYQLRVMISDPLDSLYALPQAYATVHEAMEYALMHSTRPFVARSEQFHVLMLLRHLLQRMDLIAPEVRALARRDAAENSQYCQTLYTYLICHHSLQETCARLYTHRNTVLYRIHRLKEDFGIPLDDPNRHLQLLLSVALVLLEQHQDSLFLPELMRECANS